MKNDKFIYISPAGDDANNGTSPEKAIKTLAGAMSCEIVSGTTILLEGKNVYEGSLILENLSDITIGNYGIGNPVIRSGENTALTLKECTNVVVYSLKMKGEGYRVCNQTSGISASGCGNLRIVNVEAMAYHIAGIRMSACKDVKVSGCFVHDNGSVGINTGASEGRLCEDILIEYCRAYDNAGDYGNRDNHSGSGIVIGGTNNCVVEFCEASGNGWAQRQNNVNGPVGIWCCCGCDNIVFRYNIARYNRTQPGAVDGDGLDIDGEVRNGVMEYNYTYGNEGSGYLLCEFWGDCSDVLWENNITRFNVSVDDDTRVGSYGAINMSSPQDIPFDKMYIHDNYFIANEKRHCVYNSNIPSTAKDMSISNNVLISDGTKAIQCPDQPYIVIKDNYCIEDRNTRFLAAHAAPRLTEPRDLLKQPVFGLLKDRKCVAVLEKEGFDALFTPLVQKKTFDESEGILYMKLMLDGPDTEGCDRSGNVSLGYDSLRPGVMTVISGASSEIFTPLPWWDKNKKYILQAKARLQSPDVRAYLFLRDACGNERRTYFGGNSTSYEIIELEFEGNDKWFDTGKYAGIHLEGGEGNLYAEYIKFLEIRENSVYIIDKSISIQSGSLRLSCDCYRSANEILMMHGGSVEIELQAPSGKGVEFRFSVMSEDTKATAYMFSGNKKKIETISSAQNMISMDYFNTKEPVLIGIQLNGPDGGLILKSIGSR